MIKQFLSLSIERRARIMIWLYHRYVVRPAIKELEEMGLAVEFEPDFLIDDGKETLH